ncbi:hypothetical protein SCHPADRAFT_948131 [Schizopora paradoxa]|uniref:Uncharacterized protein n=1 Tax=Schizopora paradoxa TaxID=27342 RepID=A0A0H2QWL9_9AGAM|nr:hypothetical protein SCHPADRAFT_948131 [Schizopora paradoxa]
MEEWEVDELFVLDASRPSNLAAAHQPTDPPPHVDTTFRTHASKVTVLAISCAVRSSNPRRVHVDGTYRRPAIEVEGRSVHIERRYGALAHPPSFTAILTTPMLTPSRADATYRRRASESNIVARICPLRVMPVPPSPSRRVDGSYRKRASGVVASSHRLHLDDIVPYSPFLAASRCDDGTNRTRGERCRRDPRMPSHTLAVNFEHSPPSHSPPSSTSI